MINLLLKFSELQSLHHGEIFILIRTKTLTLTVSSIYHNWQTISTETFTPKLSTNLENLFNNTFSRFSTITETRNRFHSMLTRILIYMYTLLTDFMLTVRDHKLFSNLNCKYNLPVVPNLVITSQLLLIFLAHTGLAFWKSLVTMSTCVLQAVRSVNCHIGADAASDLLKKV